jgi:RNA polymerase sigma factor for flagellar operon FliA
LVERHLDIPRRAAKLIHARVRDHIELDELVALGNAGLAEAASRFDPARGASFSTFAWYRVQGAIVDGVRRQSALPRRVWAKLVALRAAGEYLEQRGERDQGALARGTQPASGTDALDAVHGALSAIRTMYVTSLEALRDGGEDIAEPDAKTGEEQLDAVRFGRKLKLALERLPERERALLTKHYWEGKNLLEAGTELGMSKSWASRLHAQAVERLRALVAGDEP